MKEGTPDSTDSKHRPRRASLIKATESIKKVAAPKKKHVYEVEAIVSHVVVDDEVLYRVTWVGYPGEVTELTEDELSNCTELLQAYKDKQKENGDTSLQSVTPNNQANGDDHLSPTPDQSSETNENAKPQKYESNGKVSSASSVAKKGKKRNAAQDGKGNHSEAASSTKRSRKAKLTIASDSELAYTNGAVVDAYKGFSAKYDEPVILVSYKEPLPSGFEKKQDEIVPIRLIARSDPQGLITHLVELLSGGRVNVTI